MKGRFLFWCLCFLAVFGSCHRPVEAVHEPSPDPTLVSIDSLMWHDHNEQIEASMYTKDGLLIASFLIFPRSNYIAFEYINETPFNNGNKSMSVEGVLCNLLGAYAGRVWIQAIITFAGPIGGWGLIALHIGVTLLNYYACSDL